ncbi:MAG: hypothetical protein ACREFL_07000 [Stellaceae bacterium]
MTSRDADATPRAWPRSWRHALWRRRWAIGFGLALALGIVFRLVWLSDMEWKGDEAWTYAQLRAFWQSRDVPPLGMASSAGLPNAGLSLWAFIGLSALLPALDPIAIARAVALTNAAAILLLALFARFGVARAEREPWLWAAALVAVNPLAVLFSRKIWPPDILPLFTVAMLWAWWKRERWWGAFAWGVFGALIGQVQLCGFFFAAAFVGATALFDRKNVRWRAWLIGSLLGVLPLIPWLIAIFQMQGSIESANLANLLHADFYQHWLALALGLDLHYALGNDFRRFLAYPELLGWPTYLSGAFLGLVVACFATILLRFTRQLRRDAARVAEQIFASGSSTALAVNAAFWGYGILLTATARPIYLHYLVVAFALPALWLAWLERAASGDEAEAAALSRRLLASLVLAEACLTLLFLLFIHDTQSIAGDYGTAYGAQAEQHEAP